MNKLSHNNIQVDEIQSYRNVYKEDLVRMGVIDSNIFHAIMVGYSDRYLKSTFDKRIETVKMIRECIGNSITKKQWNLLPEISQTVVSKQFIKIVHTLQRQNFDIIHSIDDKKLCKILFELFISSRILNDITLNKPNINQIVDLVIMSLKVMLRDIDIKRSEFFTNHMIRFVSDVWVEAQTISYDEFKNTVKNYSETLGEEIIPFISSILNRDIYIFKDGRIKTNSDADDYKLRKSIIIEQISDNQYSVIGRRLYSSEIEWCFEPEHPLIRKINPINVAERSPMTTQKHFTFDANPVVKPVRKNLPSITDDNDDVVEEQFDEESDNDKECDHKEDPNCNEDPNTNCITPPPPEKSANFDNVNDNVEDESSKK